MNSHTCIYQHKHSHILKRSPLTGLSCIPITLLHFNYFTENPAQRYIWQSGANWHIEGGLVIYDTLWQLSGSIHIVTYFRKNTPLPESPWSHGSSWSLLKDQLDSVSGSLSLHLVDEVIFSRTMMAQVAFVVVKRFWVLYYLVGIFWSYNKSFLITRQVQNIFYVSFSGESRALSLPSRCRLHSRVLQIGTAASNEGSSELVG